MSRSEHFASALTQYGIAFILVTVAVGSMVALRWVEEVRVESASTFRHATAFAQVGRWYIELHPDGTSGELKWDEQMFRLFQPREWTPDYDGFARCIDPRDIERINGRVQTAIKSRAGCTAAFRIVRADGTIAHIRADAHVDASGKYMTGTCLPITPAILSDFELILPFARQSTP